MASADFLADFATGSRLYTARHGGMLGRMVRRLKRVGVLKFGLVLGIVQGLLGLVVFIPFALIMMLAGAFAPNSAHPIFANPATGNPAIPGMVGAIIGGGFLCVLAPVMYFILGFLMGCLGALVYNLVAKLMGGIEFEVE